MKAILYFVYGYPTANEQKKATELSEQSGERVVFRNAQADSGDYIEDCLGVTGHYPKAYADKVYKLKGKAKAAKKTAKPKSE